MTGNGICGMISDPFALKGVRPDLYISATRDRLPSSLDARGYLLTEFSSWWSTSDITIVGPRPKRTRSATGAILARVSPNSLEVN